MIYSKNKFLVTKALVLLEKTRANPQKFASTKEAFMTRVSTILEMSVPDFDTEAFYKKHLDFLNGPVYLDIYNEYTDDWAHIIIDDAIRELN